MHTGPEEPEPADPPDDAAEELELKVTEELPDVDALDAELDELPDELAHGSDRQTPSSATSNTCRNCGGDDPSNSSQYATGVPGRT
jgi:hypothetical protein